MAVLSGLKVVVDMRNSHGKYSSFIKEFKNENHLNNWLKFMHEKSAHEVIGTKIIEQ